MYRKIDDFISDWKGEEEYTVKFFSIIKDDLIWI